jgi:hypothetical protein
MLPEKTLEIKKNNRRLLSEKVDATQLYRDGAILRRLSSLYIDNAVCRPPFFLLYLYLYKIKESINMFNNNEIRRYVNGQFRAPDFIPVFLVGSVLLIIFKDRGRRQTKQKTQHRKLKR